MLIVSSTVGSPTTTGWNRRSSAASFSMCFRVLVERRRPNRMELSPREHGLEHVRGIHRAFRRARTHDRVQFVDEENDLTLVNLVTSLRTAFSRSSNSPQSGYGNEGAEVEARPSACPSGLPGRRHGRSGVRDLRRWRSCRRPVRRSEPGCSSCAAKAPGLRADFLVAANHRIEFTLSRQIGQIPPVPLKRLIGGFGVLIRHTLRSADARQRLEDLVPGDAALPQQLSGRGSVPSRRQSRRTGVRC